MAERMKILIAHDGADSSGAIFDDLLLAGLPEQAEALVLTVAELWLPPAPYGLNDSEFGGDAPFDLKLAEQLAKRAAEQIKKRFPNWRIMPAASLGSAAHEVLRYADEWRADLIVVSSGKSVINRFIFGSVSQQVVTSARCSVRVAREQTSKPDRPVKIIIGVDGSNSASAALHAVATRRWPKGSEVRLITCAASVATPLVAAQAAGTTTKPPISSSVVQPNQSPVTAAELTALEAAGLSISSLVKPGNPKQLLLNEAEEWPADMIFVGSRGFGRIKRFLLGSVSTAVVTRAHCSVEVVRE